MKLDWITDPHLDRLGGPETLVAFLDKLNKRKSDGLVVTGDIAVSGTIYDFLGLLSGAYQRPIYFVLGNHDYYGDWMETTKEKVQAVCKAVPEGILNWATESGPFQLTDDTVLIGHDGIYDGQCGLGAGTDLGLHDFQMKHGILDLAEALQFGTRHLFEKLLDLAQLSASVVEQYIKEAIKSPIKRVIIITHVPPFHEASYYRGRPSDDKSAPYYVNKTMGDMLRRVTAKYPNVQFDVYAGHTHGKRHYQASENLDVYVGSARYGRNPQFQTPIEV